MQCGGDGKSILFYSVRCVNGIVFVDLDGTLLLSGSSFSPEDLAALERLPPLGICRVVATGRSLYSARRALPPSFPIDYLIFSSGAGVLRWATGEALLARSMEAEVILRAGRELEGCDLDFMIHEPIPETHRFVYRSGSRPTSDFFRRLELYRDYARPLDPGAWPMAATQLLAISPGERADSALARLTGSLAGLSVVRATSPFDRGFTWIEIFPAGVTKGSAAAWLKELLAVDGAPTVAVGNDFNDVEILRWATHPYVVGNSPEALRNEFPVLDAFAGGGLAEALAAAGMLSRP